MRLRWSASGLLTAEKQFRKVCGYKAMPKLLAALDQGKVSVTDQRKVDQKSAAT